MNRVEQLDAYMGVERKLDHVGDEKKNEMEGKVARDRSRSRGKRENILEPKSKGDRSVMGLKVGIQKLRGRGEEKGVGRASSSEYRRRNPRISEKRGHFEGEQVGGNNMEQLNVSSSRDVIDMKDFPNISNTPKTSTLQEVDPALLAYVMACTCDGSHRNSLEFLS